MEATSTLLFIGRFIGFVIVLQSLEFVKIRDTLTEKGVWRWNELRADYLFLPKLCQRMLDAVMNAEAFNLLMKLRLTLALLVLIYPHFALSFVFLFISTFLITLRWRGSFNGGSDYMLLIILLSLSLGMLFPTFAKGALWYISLQVISSYFLAGLHKIKKEKWKKGYAITNFVSAPHYQVPSLILKKAQHREWAKFLTWSVLAFELTFPLVLFGPAVTTIYLSAGALFHLGNYFLFGLNRFFWVWIASYPALYYCSRHF